MSNIRPAEEGTDSTLYFVTAVVEQARASVITVDGPFETSLPLQWADGQVGALPVFGTREAALEYADGQEQYVVEMAVGGAPSSSIIH